MTPIMYSMTEAKTGKIKYRLDKANVIHVPISAGLFRRKAGRMKVIMEAIVKAEAPPPQKADISATLLWPLPWAPASS